MITGLLWRDTEFSWDALYPVGTNDGNVQMTLRALSLNIHAIHNRFSAPVSDFQLVYDYFRKSQGSFYTTVALDATSVVLQSQEQSASVPQTDDWDYCHADVYVAVPSRNPSLGGGTPAAFFTYEIAADEDLTSTFGVYGSAMNANSIGTRGPYPSRALDVAGTGWTHPDSMYMEIFDHEFQHAIAGQATSPSTMNELFSGAAAILASAPGSGDTTMGSSPWDLRPASASAPRTPTVKRSPSRRCTCRREPR